MNLDKRFREAKRILVLGGGITGKSVIKFLRQYNVEILLIDAKEDLSLEKITYFNESADYEKLGKIDLAIKSPGFKPTHPLVERLRKESIPILSEIEIAREFFSGKIIGITGTDGKSTTTALTYHILSKSFPNSKMGGNIGLPFIEFCQENLDFAVLELSSYQLDDSNFLNLDYSALLNIAPDHLERHGTMENYLEAKKKIINRKDSNSFFITNTRLIDKLKLESLNLKNKVLLFGDSNSDAQIYFDKKEIKTKLNTYSTKSFPLQGKHNLENLAASILLCESCGCTKEKIELAIADFTGLLYRFQKVKEWNGIPFINDSKSTNIHSMLSGLSGIDRQSPIILIIGGKQKQEDLSPFIERLKSLTAKVFLIGDARLEWEKELSHVLKENLNVLENLGEAVKTIRETINPNETKMVIFSPACASFDQYKNFEERGKHFNDLLDQFF